MSDYQRVLRRFTVAACAVILAVATAADAEADPGTDYGLDNAYRICATLDIYPTFDGILGVGQALIEEGLSPYQAGEAVGVAVMVVCPWHQGLINRFGAAHSSGRRMI